LKTQSFTHITGHGCNILGLLNFFGFIGGLYLVGVSSELKGIGLIIFCLTFFVCIMFDLTWRFQRNPELGVKRFFLSFTGGSLFYIPVWLIYLLLVIICPVIILLHLFGMF
jgi:hypothetical protein